MAHNGLHALCQAGLEFFQYLKDTDQTAITNRLDLGEVYREFSSRNPRVKAKFSSVLYALKRHNKIIIINDNVYFNVSVCVDQWHKPRDRQLQPVQNGAASPEPMEAMIFVNEEEMGVKARKRMASLLKNKLKRVHLISDKYGVSITSDHPVEDGKYCLNVERRHEHVITLNVQNDGTKPVHFISYTRPQWVKYFSLVDEHKVTKANPLLLHPGDGYKIEVHFCCSFFGSYSATLAFEFKSDLQASTTFHIVRFIEAQCMTSLGQELAPVAPYKPRSLPARTSNTDYKIVDGQRPDRLSTKELQNAVELRDYKMPPYMNQLIKSLKQPSPGPGKRRAVLESPLCWKNYSEKFHLLLYLEELQMNVDISRYNIPNNDKEYAVLLRDPVNKDLLTLEVPGVSENRPSVLQGDSLLVYPAGETGVKYRGYVHSVQLDRIRLGFNLKLLDLFLDNMKFNVEFTINRLTLKLQHRAVELAPKYKLEKVLFPTAPSYSSPQTELPKLRLFDSQLERNPEQYGAVQHIVAGSSKPAPYLVFGPPGTGKTVTLVEAIKQIERNQPSCHILACAPCNNATDLLCSKILNHVDADKVHRMYAMSWNPKYIPEDLKACSNLKEDGYAFAAKEKLMEYKIIVTTLLTAGRFITGGIPAGHFTHIFVDEAGQAVESECLIPLAGLLQADSGQVVLAGDPKQLGPILRSPFALKYGMVSLFERLMTDFALYQKDQGVFNNRFVTKLLRNYRSHPAILKIPNELFYDGELQIYADLRNSYSRWEYLLDNVQCRADFPVIFHGVTGIDEREASSPSLFNRAEVEVLMDYVKKLLQTISPRDIGIIAPYRKQVQKIRKALEKVGKDLRFKDLNTLQVGSVEEFQGQERLVILVSTVRSSANSIEIDSRFNLGFVKNDKRFNVAVTRAKALLIVVGNPLVLMTDPTWNHFIQYCRDGGGYTGFPPEDELDDSFNSP